MSALALADATGRVPAGIREPSLRGKRAVLAAVTLMHRLNVTTLGLSLTEKIANASNCNSIILAGLY